MSMQQVGQDGLDTWNRDLRATCGHFDTELAFNRALFIGEVSNFHRGALPSRTCAPTPVTSSVTRPTPITMMTRIASWSASAVATAALPRTVGVSSWRPVNCC